MSYVILFDMIALGQVTRTMTGTSWKNWPNTKTDTALIITPFAYFGKCSTI